MGIGCYNKLDNSCFHLESDKKEGLDVYSYSYGRLNSKSLEHFNCPFCFEYFNNEEKEKFKPIIDSLVSVNDFYYLNKQYNSIIESNEVDIFPELESIRRQFENYKNIIEKYGYIKYKCRLDNNKKCYLKLYDEVPKLIVEKHLDQRYHYDIWKKDEQIKKKLYNIRYKKKIYAKLFDVYLEVWEDEKLKNSENIAEKLQYFAESQINAIPNFIGDSNQLTTVFNYASNIHGLNYPEKKILKEIVAGYACSEKDKETFMYMKQNEVTMTDEEKKDLNKFIQNCENYIQILD